MKQYVWYANSSSLDSPDTIHQILAFGTLEDIKELKVKVGQNKLQKMFIENPKKIYNPKLLNFIKNYFLQINQAIDDDKYLKASPRALR